MKFLRPIWQKICGVPAPTLTPLKAGNFESVPTPSPETQALLIGERIAALTALIDDFKSQGVVYRANFSERHAESVAECAALKYRLEVITNAIKRKTHVERLTTENANLLNDLRAAEDKYQRDVYGLNNEGDPIGGEPAGGFANDAARYKSLWDLSRMYEITDYRELKEFEHYWLLSVAFDSLHVAQCKGTTISGHWITEDNHKHTMEKYRFFGPIPKPMIDGVEKGLEDSNANKP